VRTKIKHEAMNSQNNRRKMQARSTITNIYKSDSKQSISSKSLPGAVLLTGVLGERGLTGLKWRGGPGDSWGGELPNENRAWCDRDGMEVGERVDGLVEPLGLCVWHRSYETIPDTIQSVPQVIWDNTWYYTECTTSHRRQ
jgi:hypothetical protein